MLDIDSISTYLLSSSRFILDNSPDNGTGKHTRFEKWTDNIAKADGY